MNRVFLGGVVAKAPIVRTLTSGKTVVNFIVVTQDTYEKDGETRTFDQYNKCSAWGETAEIAKDFFEGQRVLVDGKLSTRSFENQMGERQYITEVVCFSVYLPDEFAMTPKEKKATNTESTEAVIEAGDTEEKKPEKTSPGVDGEEINPEDIPF